MSCSLAPIFLPSSIFYCASFRSKVLQHWHLFNVRYYALSTSGHFNMQFFFPENNFLHFDQVNLSFQDPS